MGDVLVRILIDEHHRASLAQRSWLAHAQYFLRSAIAGRYLEFINRQTLGVNPAHAKEDWRVRYHSFARTVMIFDRACRSSVSITSPGEWE